ncbi:hypothetical protein [Parvibaculum sp.]|uniref:hypothetical protein n=1 Tax=Parvibaculum sp. TaxID=2024848 RepID=UPI003BAD5517
MTAMDAILHVGITKTGTTTIQKFLRDNRDALSRQGFFVPDSVMAAAPFGQHVGLPAMAAARAGDLGMARWMSRNVIAPKANPEKGLERVHRKFLREIEEAAAHPTALISSEGVSMLNEQALGELHGLLAPVFDKITVLVYLRRQDRHSVSLFNSMVRIEKPVTSVFQDPPVPSHRFDVMLGHFAALFGRENIKVRLFEPQKMKEGDSLRDFIDVCGIEPEPASAPALVFPARQNESLSARQAVFLHLLQQEQGDKKLPPMRLRPVLDVLQCEEIFMPARAEAEAYYGQFAESNARVARDYFGTDGPLFDEDFSMYPENAGFDDYLTLDDMAQAMLKHLKAEQKAHRRKSRSRTDV